jgi:hypothetical protein
MDGNGIRVLVACEESDEVRGRLEQMGFDAWSCDLQPNRNPNAKHYQGSIFDIINDNWDMMIAHPPCTYLTVTANKWLKNQPKRESGRLVGAERRKAREEAIQFFMDLYNAPIPRIVIENPIGCMSSVFRKADQIVHPYYFGDPATKATCLWLKGLPKLKWVKQDNLFEKATTVKPEFYTTASGKKYPKWSMIDAAKIKDLNMRSKFRSKTFPGIAEAMAIQWGTYLIEQYQNKNESCKTK